MIKGKNLIKIILWESVSLYTTLTKFPVKQRKELSNILARVDCEDVSSEAIDKVVGSLHCNHFNDRRH